MKLYIAEKPALANAIAKAIGIQSKCDGYYKCNNNTVVAYTAGHALELAPPDFYDEGLKQWCIADLPIVPQRFKRVVSRDKKKLYSTIKKLADKATLIVNAGDPDPEGSYIVDSLIENIGYKGPIGRVLINDLNVEAAKRGLAKESATNTTINESVSAKVRSESDWVYGLNMTRLYTCKNEIAGGEKRVLSIGRVQTSLLSIIVNRENEIKNFNPHDFYELVAEAQGIAFKCDTSEMKVSFKDPQGRVINKIEFQKFIETKPKNGTIVKKEEKERRTAPPLPYDLSNLQKECYERLKLTSSETLEIAQSLYIKHNLITYPRTDCRYVDEDCYKTSNVRISNLEQFLNITITDKIVDNYKSPAFNEQETTAHIAIIPTEKSPSDSKLNDKEKAVYKIVGERFLAQFLGPSVAAETMLTMKIDGLCYPFIAKGTVKKEIGHEWLTGIKKDKLLPDLEEGHHIPLEGVHIKTKKTSPPSYFDEKSIIDAMENAAKFIDDTEIKKLLKEAQGLGTPATQSKMVDTLEKRKYINRGKQIRPTEAGMTLFNSLAPEMQRIDMTAIWEGMLKQVRKGQLSGSAVLNSVVTHTRNLIDRSHEFQIKIGDRGPIHNCPKCDSELKRIKGQDGYFWGCSGFKSGCKYTAQDKEGKPSEKKIELSTCKLCDQTIERKYSKTKDFHFWMHQEENHECTKFIKDEKGNPVF
ncbi:hypothetical protein HF888_16275 (plasmid) [Bermanella marisrubri]|uniref:DNA topoisomerase n=1 Tax=Bermanella marisrubri TaxID=207949 RepID=UPI001442A99F|nr:DNA topoisomerase [Bermanella marisrubri]QIZ85896.1 hypothetical protein HF888_16275 [Bermanella marisrubri]